MRLTSSILALLGYTFGASAATGGGSASTCNDLTLDIPNVLLNVTTYYPANATVSLTTPQSSIYATDLPAFCRLQLVFTTNTTANSTALVEVWLPDEWNGRLLGTGDGGVSGGINVGDLGYIAVKRGFAGMSTDNGHEGTPFDGTFAGPHNDNAIVDWSWRAFRLMVLHSKTIVQQYYGEEISKSYYLGCSNGGRQGLKEVQEFPEDFDGVVVGSPANWMSHLQGWSLHMNLNVMPETSSRFIPADVWTNVIAPEVLKQCDSLDGLADGIIADPRMCSFRPETLTCRPGQNTSTCLTGDQIFALHRIYSTYYEANQTYIFASYYPGGETGFFDGLVGNSSFQLGLNYFQYFVLNNTNFDLYDYNGDVLRIADEIDPGQANAITPNITGFAAAPHNGKLIHYVGWADQLISPGNSLYYYETVHRFMTEHTNMDIDDYYRLFPVGGMQHWYGGTGANSFGGAGDANPALANDAQHNILDAIVRWVEEGIAPDNFTAAHYTNDNATEGVDFTRPICKYPLSVHYVDGDANNAGSFECALTT